jgi:tripartite ATP-independent transporter DctM subunit
MDAGIPWQAILGILLFFVFLAAGLEILWSFVLAGATIYILLGLGVGDIPRIVYHNIDKDVLMAVAYFILAGGLTGEGGIADKLVAWVHDLVGWIRGGLAAVITITSLLFGAITGSGLTSIAALAPLLVGRMEKFGYDRSYSTGIICVSGFMGLLIPPSIPLMIYALLSDQSVAALFASTIIPGCMIAGFYLITNFFFCKRWTKPVSGINEAGEISEPWLKRFARHTWVAFPALLFPVVIVGGIFGGVFTPTEAAAVACVYALVVGVFVYRRLRWGTLTKALRESLGSIGMIMILVGFGMVFSRVLLRVGVAETMTAAILGVTESPVVILLLINVLLLVLGMFMETICILLITVPLLLPLFDAIGMNLVQAGAVICVNVGIGQVTPPFAVGLFLGARIANVPLTQIVKVAVLFIGLGALPVLFLTTYIPELSLWLPTLICGPRVVGLGP